jgi:hypothetical protein
MTDTVPLPEFPTYILLVTEFTAMDIGSDPTFTVVVELAELSITVTVPPLEFTE